MTLKEQLAKTTEELANLTGKLDVVIPRLEEMMPRRECKTRHEGLDGTLEAHRRAIAEEIRKNGKPQWDLKLITVVGAVVGILAVAVNFLGRIALHSLGIEGMP